MKKLWLRIAVWEWCRVSGEGWCQAGLERAGKCYGFAGNVKEDLPSLPFVTSNQCHSNPSRAGEGLWYCPAAMRAMSLLAPLQPIALGVPLWAEPAQSLALPVTLRLCPCLGNTYDQQERGCATAQAFKNCH